MPTQQAAPRRQVEGGRTTAVLSQRPGDVARLQVRIPGSLHRTLEACAERSGLSTVGLVRLLLEDAVADSPPIASEALRARRGPAEVVALSALVASEHTLRLLELVTPGAGRFTRDARAQALDAAQQRLEEVRTQIEEGG